MRKAGLMILGAAPSVAIGYLVLTGYILNKVRPLPITRVPGLAPTRRRPLAAAAAAR